MMAELERHNAFVDMWLFCPYHPEGTVEAFARASFDRKPSPGMALAAANALDLDLSASWVIGDSAVDIGLARAVGAQPLYVGTQHPAHPDVPSFPDLVAAVDSILNDSSGGTRPSQRLFPTHKFYDASEFGAAYAAEFDRAFRSIDLAQVAAAAAVLNDAHARDAAVFACGNGGSASIANHVQCDHVKGVRNGTELTTRVFSLSTNIELLSAIANDLSYEMVFSYQLQSQARPGDVLLAVSSSGRSPNIVRAVEWARANNMPTIAFTGFSGGEVRQLADVSVHVQSDNYGVIEDIHQACMHLLAQYIRQSHMTPESVAANVF
jgi:phosphoheptose isomerase